MPLTYAHPAAVIPLQKVFGKKSSVLSALVIGSIAPDLPYFIPWLPDRDASHSLLGLFIFCLPAGLMCYFLYHSIFKIPLLQLLPQSFMLRLTPAQCKPPVYSVAHLSVVILDIILGAFTHLVWDSFTHEDAPMVKVLPLLSYHLFSVGAYKVYVYKILQHASTFLGLSLMAFWLLRWYRQTLVYPLQYSSTLSDRSRIAVTTIILASSVITGLWSGLEAVMSSSDAVPLKVFLGNAVVSGTSTCFAGLTLFCCGWHLVRWRR
jgi:Domain of unknown function (DUF4184)